MNVDVRTRSADLENALKIYVKRRLQFSLGRFAGSLGRVRVHVQDVPGISPAVDKSCRIRAELLPARRILQQEVVDSNLYVAIDLATERIARSVHRVLSQSWNPGLSAKIYAEPDRSSGQD